MSEKSHRRKTIFFLFAISLFGFLVAKKTKNVNITDIEAKEYTIEENIKAPVEEDELVQDVFIEVDEGLNPVAEIYPKLILKETEILGTETSCRTPDITYTSEKICSRSVGFNQNFGKLDTEPEVGTVIDRDASVSLRTIVVPALLSGSPVMDSSVRQIYREGNEGDYHWTLKPAGEMVNREIVEGNMYPGDTQTMEILDAAERAKNVPFGLTYNIQGGENAEGNGTTEFTVDEYYDNNCGEKCRNYPNPTPAKFLSASEISSKSKNYAGYYEEQSGEDVEKGIEDCDSTTRFLDLKVEGSASYGCTPTIGEVILNFKKRIENLFDAKACSKQNEDDENCVNTANIVIIMESPWGSKSDCAKKGQCVTEFNDLRTGDFKAPSDNLSSKVYLLTDCEAYIEGAGNQSLKCAWDIDYISKELEFQSYDNLPNEDYPDKMEYINFHIKESENRKEGPISM